MSSKDVLSAVAAVSNAAFFVGRFLFYKQPLYGAEWFGVIASLWFWWWAIGNVVTGAEQALGSFEALLFSATLATQLAALTPTDERHGGSAFYPPLTFAVVFVLAMGCTVPWGKSDADKQPKAKVA